MALNAPVPARLPVGSSSVVQPSEIDLRRIRSMAGTIDDDEPAQSDQIVSGTTVQECDDVLPKVEDELSEQELRNLYDSEEIDRFLNLFSAVSTNCCYPYHVD